MPFSTVPPALGNDLPYNKQAGMGRRVYTV